MGQAFEQGEDVIHLLFVCIFVVESITNVPSNDSLHSTPPVKPPSSPETWPHCSLCPWAVHMCTCVLSFTSPSPLRLPSEFSQAVACLQVLKAHSGVRVGNRLSKARQISQETAKAAARRGTAGGGVGREKREGQGCWKQHGRTCWAPPGLLTAQSAPSHSLDGRPAKRQLSEQDRAFSLRRVVSELLEPPWGDVFK